MEGAAMHANHSHAKSPFIDTVRIVAAALGVLWIATSGCSRGPGTVPVSGKVTLDGQPLAGAEISFWTENIQYGAVVGPDGGYVLKVGALPGTYKVNVTFRGGREMVAVGNVSAQEAAKAVPSPPRIPARYSDPLQSVLTFTIEKSGTRAANFDLTTK
jgi:hypothetical protein